MHGCCDLEQGVCSVSSVHGMVTCVPLLCSVSVGTSLNHLNPVYYFNYGIGVTLLCTVLEIIMRIRLSIPIQYRYSKFIYSCGYSMAFRVVPVACIC